MKIVSRSTTNFTKFRQALWPTQYPVKCARGLFPGVKATGTWSWPHTPI